MSPETFLELCWEGRWHRLSPKPDSTLLDIALSLGLRIGHQCGGLGQCTTCHVYVRSGIEHCSAPSARERQKLSELYAPEPVSRLACQCRPSLGRRFVVEIP